MSHIQLQTSFYYVKVCLEQILHLLKRDHKGTRSCKNKWVEPLLLSLIKKLYLFAPTTEVPLPLLPPQSMMQIITTQRSTSSEPGGPVGYTASPNTSTVANHLPLLWLKKKRWLLAKVLHDCSLWRHPFPEPLFKTALHSVEILNRACAGTMLSAPNSSST